jgi:putative ABC transport system permease protein
VTLSSGETVRFGSNEAFATVNGTNPAVPRVFARPVARGEYLRDSDVDTRRRVAVVGAGLVDVLFEGADPLGRTISLGGVRFRVIGVFEEVGSSGFGADQDSEVHIPVTAAQRLFGDLRVDAFALKAPTTEQLDEVSAQALAVLADRYPDEEFSAVTQDQILGAVGRILGLLTSVLAAIAAISLLVGGVGVSNIMLVSVRERTRRSACARRSAPGSGTSRCSSCWRRCCSRRSAG